MRSQLRVGGLRAVLVMAITAMLASHRASADVITIDDGGREATASIPFTCSTGPEDNLWKPAMGFVYRNVEPFELVPGDTIAFDIQMRATDPDDIGFRPEVDIALAHASDPQDPFKPDDLPGPTDFTTVARNATASGAGNRIVHDYDLVFTVDAPFHFPGGGLIIRITNPQGALATRSSADCLPVITADAQPTGTNRLVGTFKLEAGEWPWTIENTTIVPDVPYVRISWTRCGDGRVSGAEICDDGNTDNTDDCTNACLAPACGDGVVQQSEACDNSADPDHPDPFCDDHCHLAAFAKGSGCSSGAGVGMAVVLVIVGLGLARRRRTPMLAVLIAASWAGSAHAQARTEGFRVDRFAMAPSVDDGLIVQDPGVLRDMAWSLDATLGFTTTVLRVVPRLSSDTGVDVVGSRLSAYLDFALGWGDRFEFNLAVPFALAQSTESGVAAGFMLKRAGTTALGDARLGGSMLLYSRSGGPQLGLALALALPVGSQTSFTGDGGVGVELLGTAGFAGRGYRVLVNGGVRFRPEADYVTTDQGTELLGRAGILVPLARDRLMTSLELDVMARASGSDAFRRIGSPILALLGARYHFDGGMYAGAGIGAGLTEAPGSPSLRTLITVGYSPEPRPPRRGLVPRPDDSDGDGIIDKLDKCPSQPEDFNGFEDEDGCPDAPDKTKPPEPDAPLTLEQVTTLPAPIEFKFDTAIMLPGAEVYLNQVLRVLQNHPEVTKLEIQGHTSAEGGAEYNLRLSNDRATAVFTWLVDHGIDANRLVPRGYGLTQPLMPNDTEPHRQHNRRVQFRLLEQASGTTPVNSQLRTAPPTDAPPPASTVPSQAAPAAPSPSPAPPRPVARPPS